MASTKPWFKDTWTAHNGTTFGPGTYTIDITPEDPTDTLTYTFTVGPGQVGGHILFDWKSSFGPSEAINVDVVNVWDVTGNTYTSRDWDQDGKNGYYPVYCEQLVVGVPCPDEPNVRGAEVIEGPFIGFNLNFNFTVVPEPISVALVGPSLVGLVGLRRRIKR